MHRGTIYKNINYHNRKKMSRDRPCTCSGWGRPRAAESVSLTFQPIAWDFIDQTCECSSACTEHSHPRLTSLYKATGRDADGGTVSVTITGFGPFFYVRLRSSFDSDARRVVAAVRRFLAGDRCWSPPASSAPSGGSRTAGDDEVAPELVRMMGSLREVRGPLVRHYSHTNGYSTEKFPFLRLSFWSEAACKRAARFFQKGGHGLDGVLGPAPHVYESRVDSIARLCHSLGVRPHDWITVSGSRGGKCPVYGGANVHVALADDPDLWSAQITAVDRDTIAPFVVASFDIECYNGSNRFPTPRKTFEYAAVQALDSLAACRKNEALARREVHGVLAREILIATGAPADTESPEFRRLFTKVKQAKMAGAACELGVSKEKSRRDKELAMQDLVGAIGEAAPRGPVGDPVIQIGVVLTRHGQKAPFCRWIACLGSTELADSGGVSVETYDREIDVIRAFFRFIRDQDPDVVTGYNVFGFDWKYIAERCEELGIDGVESSRVAGMPPSVVRRVLSSAAKGDNVQCYMYMPGRLSHDLYGAIRDSNKQLASYKLDAVAEFYLSGKVLSLDGAALVCTAADGAEPSAGDFICLTDDRQRSSPKLQVRSTERLAGGEQRVTLAERAPAPGAGAGWVRWSAKKDDVSPQDIMIKFKGSAADRGVVAKYCVQDCALVSKVYVLTQQHETTLSLGNIGGVTMDTVANRGQGVKIHSMIIGYTSRWGFRHADRFDTAGVRLMYEGAVVLEPQKGIHGATMVCDYASLYPSSMIEYNLSPETLCVAGRDPPAADVPTKSIEISTASGARTLTFVQDPVGIVPRILEEMRQERKTAKRRMAQATDSAVRANWNARQNAVKVFMNSVYGAFGASTSQVFFPEISMATTAVGRLRLKQAKEFAETRYAANVVYGDSVAGYTPLGVMVGGTLRVLTADALWASAAGARPGAGPGKEYAPLQGVSVWTERGWTAVTAVMRHACDKPMYRVAAGSGCVDVTADHSLVRASGATCAPTDLKPGDELLTSFPDPAVPASAGEGSAAALARVPALARVSGMFVCGGDECGDDFCVTSQDLAMLRSYELLCATAFGHDFQVLESPVSSGTYRLAPRGGPSAAGVARWFRRECYSGGAKAVPGFVLNGDKATAAAFLRGACDADGKYRAGLQEVTARGELAAQGLYVVLRRLGFRASVLPEALHRYRLRWAPPAAPPAAGGGVRWVRRIPYPKGAFVYDLTTQNGHFAAGIGDVVVHNTDSIMCVFPDPRSFSGEVSESAGAVVRQWRDSAWTSDDAIKYAWSMGESMTAEFQHELAAPHVLEPEKVFAPYALLSKKRYFGNVYESADTRHFHRGGKGTAEVRRDFSTCAKVIYSRFNTAVLESFRGSDWERGMQEAVKALDRDIRGIGDMPLEHFILSRELRLSYKAAPAHKILAERMRTRDAGSAPQVNERVQYAFVYRGETKTPRLQADRIEDLATIQRDALEIDYCHYIEETWRLVHEVLTLIPGEFGASLSLDAYLKEIRDARLRRKQRLVTDFFKKV